MIDQINCAKGETQAIMPLAEATEKDIELVTKSIAKI